MKLVLQSPAQRLLTHTHTHTHTHTPLEVVCRLTERAAATVKGTPARAHGSGVALLNPNTKKEYALTGDMYHTLHAVCVLK